MKIYVSYDDLVEVLCENHAWADVVNEVMKLKKYIAGEYEPLEKEGTADVYNKWTDHVSNYHIPGNFRGAVSGSCYIRKN